MKISTTNTQKKPTRAYLLMKADYERTRNWLNSQWNKPNMMDHINFKIKQGSILCFKYNYSLDKIVQNFDSQ